MRFVFYNIAYGTGSPRGSVRQIWDTRHYLKTPERAFRRAAEFIRRQKPDLVGVVEADAGSPRTGGFDQVAFLADLTGCGYRLAGTKYGPGSVLGKLPYLRHHANALLSRTELENPAFEFLPCGTKKLMISATVNGIRVVVVHLALTRQVRRRQFAFLAERLAGVSPLVLAGDFNTFGGEVEFSALREQCGLTNPNTRGIPTYPVWNPAKELDYLLISQDLRATGFAVPHVRASDHLPLVLDFERR